ncbi:hypothetical protein NQ156_12170 [Microbacterium sp. zg.Y625]|uniref:protealysin inhibitor emfourin n=1 Tax=Microbacterium jiangjiandongii TaxID=3049071 RepID=UPI00214BABD6|nr:MULTISPECIES: protealysin inhibitor emfourin [unclassified Microbacterium]MCR2793822.1 hypothetical protein [Microbacterium sp. zg.Y625]WIM26162.1 hypothetical protein QNO14_03650 [Microbacterium sp. zg-Y625]
MPKRDDPAVSVTVVRTGGIAGLRRTWHVAPVGADARRWLDLIEHCPWAEPRPDRPSGADRFSWKVSAEIGSEHREARLQDAEVTGPWRTLVDAVRASPDVTLRGGGRRDPSS